MIGFASLMIRQCARYLTVILGNPIMRSIMREPSDGLFGASSGADLRMIILPPLESR
jgi:hypothetical protein